MNRAWYGYRLFALVMSPFVALWWSKRMLLQPIYRPSWQDRFGFLKGIGQKNPLWVHAVSVGEVITIAPFLHRLVEAEPKLPILLTVTTPMGLEQAKKRMPKGVFLRYAPFDMTGPTRRFLNIIQPRLLLLVETELWPNWLWHCQARNIPVLLFNARLSTKSYQGYRRIAPWVGSALRTLNVFAQTQDDANRFLALGIAKQNVEVVGNLKYDIQQSQAVHDQAAKWKAYLGKHKWVMAASTHPGEEVICVEAFVALKAKSKDYRLCIAPRHPVRSEEIQALCEKQGLSVERRSNVDVSSPWDDRADVLLVDTLGELNVFYGAVGAALVGGSLIEHGGHNPIEPTEMGTPVITGPHVFNFSEVYYNLEQEEGCYFVHNAEGLLDAWQEAFSASGKAKVKAAKKVVKAALGATDRHLAALQRNLSHH